MNVVFQKRQEKHDGDAEQEAAVDYDETLDTELSISHQRG